MSKRPTDDLEPAAKKGKRGNARQLTKDDASDEEEEVPGFFLLLQSDQLSLRGTVQQAMRILLGVQVAPGEMTKASADVMKGRRVVKARRGAGPAAPSASANPFGGFSLLAQPDEPGEEALETAVPPEKVRSPAVLPETHSAESQLACGVHRAPWATPSRLLHQPRLRRASQQRHSLLPHRQTPPRRFSARQQRRPQQQQQTQPRSHRTRLAPQQ